MQELTPDEAEILEFIVSHPGYNTEAVAAEFENSYYDIYALLGKGYIDIDPETFTITVRSVT